MILVIHVCRRGEPSQFTEAYRRHSAGYAHILQDVVKGRFGGFDLGTYRKVAERSKEEFICCLNCNSEIQADNWLAIMASGIILHGAGLVGTTASCESMLTNAERDGRPFNWIRRWFFPPFPNPHIRTTGFMMRRELFLELCPRWFPTKRHCYLFESGHYSLTRRVWALGFKVRLACKNGTHQFEWNTKTAFRSGDQSNLLIADNQTCRYQRGTTKERTSLAEKAWGI